MSYLLPFLCAHSTDRHGHQIVVPAGAAPAGTGRSGVLAWRARAPSIRRDAAGKSPTGPTGERPPLRSYRRNRSLFTLVGPRTIRNPTAGGTLCSRPPSSGKKGRSRGRRMFGLRVVSDDGTAISLGQAFLRRVPHLLCVPPAGRGSAGRPLRRASSPGVRSCGRNGGGNGPGGRPSPPPEGDPWTRGPRRPVPLRKRSLDLPVGHWGSFDVDFFWPIFPLLGWSIGLAVHAWKVFGGNRGERRGFDPKIRRARRGRPPEGPFQGRHLFRQHSQATRLGGQAGRRGADRGFSRGLRGARAADRRGAGTAV
jgi:hypothetical protein